MDVSHRPLLTLQEVPQWLQFNRFIVTGYRPELHPRDALRTLFSWHNETLNVWSHLVPALWMVWYAAVSPVPGFLFQLGLWSFIFIFFASSCYHLFMPCCRSAKQYRYLINCDILGSLVSISLSAYTFIVFGNRCLSTWTIALMAGLFTVSFGVMLNIILFSTMTVADRVKLFGLHCLFRLTLNVLIAWPKAVEHGLELAFYNHTASFFVLACGSLFNALRIPERWLPRSRWVDCWLNSHQIWHYMCVHSLLMTMRGSLYDYAEWDATLCE